MSTNEKEVHIQPKIVTALSGAECPFGSEKLFTTEEENRRAALVLEQIDRFRDLPSSRYLRLPSIRAEIVAALEGQRQDREESQSSDKTIVEASLAMFEKLTIDIPLFMQESTEPIASRVTDFVLDERLLEMPKAFDPSDVTRDESIPLVEQVAFLINDFATFSPERDRAILLRLAEQVIAFGERTFGEKYADILTYDGAGSIARQVAAQAYERSLVTVPRREYSLECGFIGLKPFVIAAEEVDTIARFRPDRPLSVDKGALFTGFSKCLYPVQRLDCPRAYRLAAELEERSDVVKWCRAAPEQFGLYWGSLSKELVCDFIVEKDKEILFCDFLPEEDWRYSRFRKMVVASWCHTASTHTRGHGGKRWRHVEIGWKI